MDRRVLIEDIPQKQQQRWATCERQIETPLVEKDLSTARQETEREKTAGAKNSYVWLKEVCGEISEVIPLQIAPAQGSQRFSVVEGGSVEIPHAAKRARTQAGQILAQLLSGSFLFLVSPVPCAVSVGVAGGFQEVEFCHFPRHGRKPSKFW